MPITADQIAPLLAGSYRNREAVWAVVERLLLPTFGQGLARIWVQGMEGSPKDLALQALADFAKRVIEKAGIKPPDGEMPADLTPWLRTVLMNQARDLRRAALREDAKRQKQRVELDEGRVEAPTVQSSELEPPRKPDARLRALEKRSPLYVLGLYCWHAPAGIDRPLLEAASKATRARAGQRAGLVRAPEETLALLRRHRERLAKGIAGDGEAQKLMAWILRSDHPDFEAWARNNAQVLSATETIIKWNTRAAEVLRKMKPPIDAEEET